MKNFFTQALLCLFLLSGVVRAGNEQTIANLQAAYKGESTASSLYAAYAAQALKEGYPQIAVLFSAASRSESIHATNHKTVLTRMGQTVPEFKAEVTARSTRENLQAAIDGESNESMKMYPDYIAQAKSDNQSDAVKSMRWAMETEKKHMIFFQNALFALNGSTVTSLPKLYWVCPKCGNTYDVPTPESMCSFCGTSSSKFIRITK